jgi:ATP-binding cassette subfamily C protein CydCD
VSGGERQRLGIARALLADRPITVLDEPTAHLDAATGDALAAEILAATDGRTALVVTHRPEQVAGLPVVRIASGSTDPGHPAPRRRAAHRAGTAPAVGRPRNGAGDRCTPAAAATR